MEALEGSIESLVVSGEPVEAGSPCEGAFHHPTAWQQHEASFGHGMLDHLQLQAVFLGGLGVVRPGITLIHISQFHVVAGHLLHLFGQGCDLLAIDLVSRRHGQRHQVPERIDRDVNLRSLAALGPVVTGTSARLRRRLAVVNQMLC